MRTSLPLLAALSLSLPAYGQVAARPAAHFTPPRGWMNDPNGLLYTGGQYHLFYQFNPGGTDWGDISWGHAVSRDLTRWQDLGVAIPADPREMIFSGSAVRDRANTAGFGRDALVAVYTSLDRASGVQSQHLAFSRDGGRRWVKYAGNPVLDVGSRDFRDPRVFWHAPTRSWVMALALATRQRIALYRSADLRHWEKLSEFGPAGAARGIWEMPDLFPLPLGTRTRWVLAVSVNGDAPWGGSGVQYWVGDFDGRRFQPDPVRLPGAGRVVADFETPALPGWTAQGDAFTAQPRPGTLSGQQDVSGFQGRGLLNSFTAGDAPQGTLTSPPFRIDRAFVNFLIGGGRHPGETGAELIVDGQVVRQASGQDSERLTWHTWDVRAWYGREARLRVVDRRSDSWGHVLLDQVSLGVTPAAETLTRWADHGMDFYAPTTFADTPGRRVWLGWMSNWLYAARTPATTWRGAMSLPRTLQLVNAPGGARLAQTPVVPPGTLTYRAAGRTLSQVNRDLQGRSVGGAALDLILEVTPPPQGRAGLLLRSATGDSTQVGVDGRAGRVYVDRARSGNVTFDPAFPGVHSAPLPAPLTSTLPVRLRVVVDRTSVEVFAAGGQAVVTSLIFPRADTDRLALFTSSGDPPVRLLEVRTLTRP